MITWRSLARTFQVRYSKLHVPLDTNQYQKQASFKIPVRKLSLLEHHSHKLLKDVGLRHSLAVRSNSL